MANTAVNYKASTCIDNMILCSLHCNSFIIIVHVFATALGNKSEIGTKLNQLVHDG